MCSLSPLVTRLRHVLTALVAAGLLLVGAAACGGADSDSGESVGEPTVEPTPRPTATPRPPGERVLFVDPTSTALADAVAAEPTATRALPERPPPVTPAAYELPETCEELEAFASEQADIVSSNGPGSQEAVDARAAYNAAVFERQFLGCNSDG